MRTPSSISTFVPVSSSRERTIYLHGRPEMVFPLFEPLNEKKWAEGWDPEVLYPPDGTVREQMIFLTKPRFEDEDSYRWILTRYDIANSRISYHVSAGDRIWFIDIACREHEMGTAAKVCYTYIGLSADAVRRNNAALEIMFKEDLKDWEDAVNTYLASTEHALT